MRLPPSSTLFPYTTLFRSRRSSAASAARPSVAAGSSRPRWLRIASIQVPAMIEILSRSEEHTSELQSHHDLVCRLLLEKKKKKKINYLGRICDTNHQDEHA